jgi:hypothetical protein
MKSFLYFYITFESNIVLGPRYKVVFGKHILNNNASFLNIEKVKAALMRGSSIDSPKTSNGMSGKCYSPTLHIW